jgi:SAM-dependent methyltransferase
MKTLLRKFLLPFLNLEPPMPTIPRLDCAQTMASQLSLSKDILDLLFTTTARYWREHGSDAEDIYFSVVSRNSWRRRLTWEDKLSFFATGKFYVDRVVNAYETFTGKSVRNASCIDFGCGVGRLSFWAVSQFRLVFGVDFSVKHLDEAYANIAQGDSRNSFRGILINNLSDLVSLPKVDLCYSFITLQHNTPPIMAMILNSLLSALNPGGVAVLHIPLAIPDYHFDANEYLNNPQSGVNMEIHILPKRDIYDIARNNDCQILYSECIGGVDIAYSEDIVFRKNPINL